MKQRTVAMLWLVLATATLAAPTPNSAPPPQASPGTAAKCLVIGHRGNSAVFFENTLPAFESAYSVGAGMIEVDVRLSKDGVPVIFHDDLLETTTSARGPVADMTFEQLKAVKAGSLRDDTSTDSIPTLEEVLLLAQRRGGRVLLDIKVDGMAPAIAALFARLSLPPSMAAIGTWNDTQADEYLRHLPTAEILNTQGVVPNWGPELITKQRERGIDTFELALDNVPPGFVEAAHAQGLRVYVYTVNKEADMRRLIALGVDGIETDLPEFLVHILRDHANDR